mmetsp:Transcript_6894/g.12035  ORF Transcript_6894/g.12035 Transcript_6894/m.12035 type:complete len:107 (-) Transcript_6894:427-747(-)
MVSGMVTGMVTETETETEMTVVSWKMIEICNVKTGGVTTIASTTIWLGGIVSVIVSLVIITKVTSMTTSIGGTEQPECCRLFVQEVEQEFGEEFRDGNTSLEDGSG